MDGMFAIGRITAGIDVYGADGGKVGTIVAIQTDYVVVQQEGFVAGACSIPTSAIVSVDDGKAYLNAATDRVLNQGGAAEPVVEEGAVSTDFPFTPVGAAADAGFMGAEALDDNQGDAAWSKEHAQPAATTRNSPDEVDEQRTLEMPVPDAMNPLTPAGVAAEAEVGTEPGQWSEWGTDTVRREERRIDEDVAAATTGDAHGEMGAGRQDGTRYATTRTTSGWPPRTPPACAATPSSAQSSCGPTLISASAPTCT